MRMERERREPSRELVKSRKEVTPSEAASEDGCFGGVSGVGNAIGVSLKGNLEVPCTKSGMRVIVVVVAVVPAGGDAGGWGKRLKAEDCREGFLLELAVV